MKSPRITAIAAALSLLPMGQPMLLGTLTVSTAAIVISASQAQAKDELDIAEIAKAITIRLEGATQGSGFIYERDFKKKKSPYGDWEIDDPEKGYVYKILTAWHVVKDNTPGEEIGIIMPDNQEYVVEIEDIQKVEGIDLALILISSKKEYKVVESAPVEELDKIKNSIYVAGYPLDNFNTIRVEKGNVVNTTYWASEGYGFLYDNDTKPGMSGGPILNHQGKIIGMHGLGEKDSVESIKKKYNIKTGVNLGLQTYLFARADKKRWAKYIEYMDLKESPKYQDTPPEFKVRTREMTIGDETFEVESTDRFLYSQYYLIQAEIAKRTNKLNLKQAINYQDKALNILTLERFDGEDFSKEQLIEFAPIYYSRGRNKKQMKDYKGSIEDYNKALEYDEINNVIYYLNLSESNYLSGNYQEAVNYLRIVINLTSDKSKLINSSGMLFYLKDNYKIINDINSLDAIITEEIMSNTITEKEISKNDEDKFIKKIGEINIALELLFKDINRKKNVSAYLGGRASYYLHGQKNYKKAIEYYSKAIDIYPFYSNNFFERSRAKWMIKDINGSCKDMERAYELGNEDAKERIDICNDFYKQFSR